MTDTTMNTGAASLSDERERAAITACALMIKGICLTRPNAEWTGAIEDRIQFMLKQMQAGAAIAAGGAQEPVEQDERGAEYGATDFGYTFAGINLEEGDKRLMAMLVSALGTEHPAIEDLTALLFRAASTSANVAQGANLDVWYGPMPESNGKTNWTAILHKGDLAEGHTIDRSEYPDRVRYAADCVRYLIGELKERPWILDYDADKHSGYVANVAQGAEAVASLRRIAHELRTYNPAADEYKGEHIHKVWAREIEALLPAASNGESK